MSETSVRVDETVVQSEAWLKNPKGSMEEAEALIGDFVLLTKRHKEEQASELSELERQVKILREVVSRYIKNEEASNEGIVSEEMWPIHNAAKMLVGKTNCPRWDSEAAGEGMEQLKREVFGTE